MEEIKVNPLKREKKAGEKAFGGKKWIWIILILVILAAIAGGVIFWWMQSHKFIASETVGPQNINITRTENVLTMTGTTVVGINEETFDVDSIETTLHIEEVYLSSNEEVEKHTPILKVRQEDVDDARIELENALEEAKLAYRAGVITCKQSGISAKYDYDSSILAGNYAQQVYDETLQELEQNRKDAQEALEDALEQQEEYKDAVENNAYDEKYSVSYLEAKYAEDLELLQKKVSKWGLKWSDVTGMNDDGEAVPTSDSGRSNPYLSAAQGLYKEVDEEAKELESAKETYEEKMNEANYGLQKLQVEVPILELKVTEANNAYEEGVISAKAALNITKKKAEIAQDTYDTAIKKAQEELDSLKDDMEDAQENLDTFNEMIGEGIMYTSCAGTVLIVNARENTTLTAGQMILAFRNFDELSVSVSVAQAYIDKLRVGDEATIIMDEGGTYTGKITKINPVSSSSSRTSVAYSVEIQIDGDISGLEANMSAQVMFQIKGDEDDQ